MTAHTPGPQMVRATSPFFRLCEFLRLPRFVAYMSLEEAQAKGYLPSRKERKRVRAEGRE